MDGSADAYVFAVEDLGTPEQHRPIDEVVRRVEGDLEALVQLRWVRSVHAVAGDGAALRVAYDGDRSYELVSEHGVVHVRVRWDVAPDPRDEKDRIAVVELAVKHARTRLRERLAWLTTRAAHAAYEDERDARIEAEAHRAAIEEKFVERDRMAAVSAMFASVAHDIRSPLTALVCNLRLLEETLSKRELSLDTTIEGLFDDNRLACELIEGVLTGMRTYASASGTPGPVRVRLLVESTIRLFRWHMAQKGVRFDYSVEGDPYAWGTPGELCQVLLNVLANAADASPRGGSVRLVARGDRAGAYVRVYDEGPGIAPEISERVFEPFHTTKEGGLGIGLAVARAMARRHGGDLHVVPEDRPRGACIELVLQPATAAND